MKRWVLLLVGWGGFSSIPLDALPPGSCGLPPGKIERVVHGRRDPKLACGDFGPGDLLEVQLVITDLRKSDAECLAPSGIIISETPPAGWLPLGISDGGDYDSSTGAIRWVITVPQLVVGKTVSYQVIAEDSPDPSVSWVGVFSDTPSPFDLFPIEGDVTLSKEMPFAACGGIRCWNVLGGFLRSGGAAPGEDAMRLDYLTDGLTHEKDFVWYPGARIQTALYGDGVSASAAAGLTGGTAGRNASGIPEVFAWSDPDGQINLNDELFGGDPSNVMAYCQTYITNTTGSDLNVSIGCSSDDSIQVLLNGEEVWIHSIGRADSNDCAPQDVSPDGVRFLDPVVLRPGENSLIVKVFEGIGGWSFSVRFQDAGGNAITEGLHARTAPDGACIDPPLQATRSFPGAGTTRVDGSDAVAWSEGVVLGVRITLSGIRATSSSCPHPASADIVETAPPGWTPFSASDGGTIAGNTVSWHLTAASLHAGKVLSYSVTAGSGAGAAIFTSRVSDASAISPSPVVGPSTLYNPNGIANGCFLSEWLLLGPFQQPGVTGANPGIANIRRDHLTDGAAITERNVAPRAGDVVNTAYNGAARSTGLATTSRADLNPGGVPTWYAWSDSDDTIDFGTVALRDVDQAMFHAVAYVNVEADSVVDIGLASDDSVQVLLDDQEIWIHNIARNDGGPGSVQDVVRAATTPALNPLAKGRHKLLVKVFDGGGQNTFRLRFQDPTTGQGVCEGISVCLDPDPAACGAGPQFLRGDSNTDGVVSIGDAVNTLDYLFLGGGAVSCPEAADADGNGALQLTDVVRTLDFVYRGMGTLGAYPACERAKQACVYPISPCGPKTTRHPQPILQLDIDIDRVVEEGKDLNPVTGTVRLRNTEPSAFDVRGWSLGVRATPPSLCSIVRATVDGTLGAKIPEGLRDSGFEKTELVSGPGDHGAVSTVVLGFLKTVALPGDERPSDLLKLELGAPFPAGGCVPCRLEFVDGLEGSGEPVRNIVDFDGNDVQPFSRPVEVRFCSAIEALAPDGPAASVSLGASSPSALFKLEPKPAVGSVITLSLDGFDGGDASALYVRWGAVPNPAEFDQAADVRFRASQRLVIPFARAETCYVLVLGNVVHGAAVDASLHVATGVLALERVSSDCGGGGCSGQFHVAVQGGGFDVTTTFALEPSPGQSIPASSTTIVSVDRAELTFVVSGAPEGLYALVAQKPAVPDPFTARLDDALRVTKKRIGPRLETSLAAPAYYREGGLRRMTLRYSNSGDEEMRAPIFEVNGPAGTQLGLATDTGLHATDFPNFPLAGVGGAQLDERPLQVLGISPTGVAGRLPPGASGEIVILFRHPNPFSDAPGPDERLRLVVRKPDPKGGVTWSGLTAPVGLTPAEWNARWPSIAAKYGADYNEALAEIAARLSKRGTKASSVKDLVRFAVREAQARPSSFVIGIARGVDKSPLPSRTVAALAGNALRACATTDFEGSFALGPLPNGTYQLAIEGFAVAPMPVVLAGSADKFAVVVEALSEDGSSIHCPAPATEQGLAESAPGIPSSLLEEAAAASLKPAVSIDPNTKEGPDEGLTVKPGQTLSYTIHFENCPNPPTTKCPDSTGASGAARVVVIVDELPSLLDPDTIVFTEGQIGKDEHVEFASGGSGGLESGYSVNLNSSRYRMFAETEVSVGFPNSEQPVHLSVHFTGARVKTTDDLKQLTYDLCGAYEYPPPSDCLARMELETIANGIAAGKQYAVWVVDTHVPLTESNHPEEFYFDDRVGFLPPNQHSPEGEGHVSYDIAVAPSAKDGEKIENSASIKFDTGSTLTTKLVSHTVNDPGKPFVRGDSNGNGVADISDAKYTLVWLFNKGPDPPCIAAADVNNEDVRNPVGAGTIKTVNIADPISLLNHLFRSGPAPSAPFPGCDLAKVPVELGCEHPLECR